jgi:hypothetical protein
VWADAKASFTPDAHPLDTILQAGDCAPLADAKGIVLVLLDRVAAIEKEAVPDLDFGAALGDRTVPELEVLVFDAAAAALHLHGADQRGLGLRRVGLSLSMSA